MTEKEQTPEEHANSWSWGDTNSDSTPDNSGYGQFDPGTWRSPAGENRFSPNQEKLSGQGNSLQGSPQVTQDFLQPQNSPKEPVSSFASGANTPGFTPYNQGYQQVQPGIIALHPLTMGEILNGAFMAVRQAPSVMLGLVLGVWAVFAAAVGLIVYLLLPDQIQVIEDMIQTTDSQDFISNFFSLIEGLLISSLVTYQLQMVITAITTAICVTSVATLVLGRRPSIADAWESVKGHLGAVLLYSLILIGINLVTYAMFLLPWMSLLTDLTPSTVIYTAIGSLLLYLIGFIASTFIFIRLLFTVPSIIMENIGLMPALKRSWALTKNSFWRIFGTMLLVYLLLGIVLGILSNLFGFVTGIFIAQSGSIEIFSTISTVLSLITYALYMPFIAGVQTLLYIDIRMRREGLALTLLKATQSE